MNVLITGAAGGLGRALACECARRNFGLFLTDINKLELERLAVGLRRRFGVRIETHSCDLTRTDDVFALMNRVEEADMPFTMLLNVAGIDYEGGFESQKLENLLTIVKLNIEATLSLTHAALERRPLNTPFHIVFVSSLASINPMPLKATYAASKRFLLDFSYALGRELESERVYTTSLCPGGLATTVEAMRGIAAQGVWGNLTANKLEVIARKTITKALRGRRVYIPGALNRILAFCSSIIPRALTTKLLLNRWRTAQKKWLYDV